MKRLYFRIILGVLIVLVLSFSLPALIFRLFGEREPRPMFPAALHGSVELLRDRLERVPPSELDRVIDSLRILFDFPLRLADSSDIASLGPPAVREFRDDVMRGQGGPGPRLIHLPLRQAGRFLIAGPMPVMPTADKRLLVLLVSLVLVIVGVAGFLMVAPVARNLRSLEMAALHFGEGHLDSRAVVRSRDAVGRVADRFNRMAESIQQLIHRERQLLQSVSHELRTPIARIRFSLDMLANAGTRHETDRRISEIDGEISEIDLLIGELLDFNRLQSESVPLDRQAVAVRPILEDVVRRLHDFRPEIDVGIDLAPDDQCTVMADRLLFRRAIQNLVANALRYATSRVTIKCTRADRAAVVEICDDGPGIPADEREHILKPFYRVDQSGSKESGGAGLGLAIVSRIIELHDGSLDIGDAGSTGARFTTRWPDVQEQS